MKRISTNNDDCSFENKYKFEDLYNGIKALGGSIIKNGKQTCFLAMMVGCVLFSANNSYKIGTDVVKLFDTYIEKTELNKYFISYNDDLLQMFNNGIIVVNASSSVEQKYYFSDNNLFDNKGNIVSLNSTNKPICFIHCNINRETLENMQLSYSQTKILNLNECSIDNECIQCFPSTLEDLSLDRCIYINNLNDLPKLCPNITKLSLNAIPNLSDLSFIYNLPNLKEVYISDSVYINEELLNYLRDNNIKTSITQQDIINSKKIDEIISNIITPDMSDRDKIQAICLYVLNNVEYDIAQTFESNLTPLTCVLDDGKGVCASYAYLTNVLLNKANINSFNISNGGHAWNVIELDDKYYYIDTTKMDDSAFYNFFLKTLNITRYYMIDTHNTFATPMSNPEDDRTIIPLSLIEDIQNGTSEKYIFEKYGGQVGNFVVILLSILSVIAIPFGYVALNKIIHNSPEWLSNIKDDYKEILEEYKSHKI